MKVFPTDPTNLITLEGVGEVPRPTDIDPQKTGFNRLVSLRIYAFTAGQVIYGEAEGDEVIIVLLQGDLTVKVTGQQTATRALSGRHTVFGGPAQAVYLPPGYSYRLELRTGAEVAYARARAEGRFPPRFIEARVVKAAEEAQNDTKVYEILGPGEAEALECVETLTPGGGRYTVPERFARAEVLTHYRLEPADTHARYQSGRNGEPAATIHQGDTVASQGRDTVVAAPNQQLYGLTVLVATE